MKKVILGLVALTIAFIAQRLLFQQFKEAKISKQLAASIEKATSMSTKFIKVEVNSSNNIKISDLTITPQNFTSPFIKIGEFLSHAEVLNKGGIQFSNTSFKKITFPFLENKNVLELQKLNNLAETFLNQSKQVSDLRINVQNQLKSFLFEYEKMINYFTKNDKSNNYYQHELKQAQQYLKKEITFPYKLPTINPNLSNIDIFTQILKPMIETFIATYGNLLYKVKEAQQKLLQNKGKDHISINLDKVIFKEGDEFIGKIIGLDTRIPNNSPPLKLLLQGDLKKYKMQGLKLDSYIKSGKRTAIVSKINIMSIPILFDTTTFTVSIKSTSFAIAQQVNINLKIIIEDFNKDSTSKDRLLNIFLKLIKKHKTQINIISKNFNPQEPMELQSMQLDLKNLTELNISRDLETILQAHSKELIIAELKSSETYQKYLSLREKLTNLILSSQEIRN